MRIKQCSKLRIIAENEVQHRGRHGNHVDPGIGIDKQCNERSCTPLAAIAKTAPAIFHLNEQMLTQRGSQRRESPAISHEVSMQPGSDKLSTRGGLGPKGLATANLRGTESRCKPGGKPVKPGPWDTQFRLCYTSPTSTPLTLLGLAFPGVATPLSPLSSCPGARR